MKLFRELSAEQLEAEYNLSARRPDYATSIAPDWEQRSKQARSEMTCTLDVPYGISDRQKFDVYPASDAGAPTLIYIHGGYWWRGDRSLYSFLAQSFVRHAVSVVVPGYDLCPHVTVTDISQQLRHAIAAIWRKGPDLGIGRDAITVMGHSAGGHLTGMMMGTNWPQFDAGLPKDLIKAGIPISAINELEPIIHTSINTEVRMDEDEARRESPMKHPPVTNAPLLIVAGAAETSEFLRQSDLYASTFASADRPIERYDVPDADHFDEINALADDQSEFFKKALALIRSCA